MADTKILQIILDRLTSLEQVVSKGFMDLAALADDAPAREEFENLEGRVEDSKASSFCLNLTR